MIENDRQYGITREWASRFQERLEKLRKQPRDEQINPILLKAQDDSLKSQLESLEAEMREYESRNPNRKEEN